MWCKSRKTCTHRENPLSSGVLQNPDGPNKHSGKSSAVTHHPRGKPQMHQLCLQFPTKSYIVLQQIQTCTRFYCHFLDVELLHTLCLCNSALFSLNRIIKDCISNIQLLGKTIRKLLSNQSFKCRI